MKKIVLKNDLVCVVNVFVDHENGRNVKIIQSICCDEFDVIHSWEDVVRTRDIFKAFYRGDLEKNQVYEIDDCAFKLNLDGSRPVLSLECATIQRKFDFTKIEADANSSILTHLINKCEFVYPSWMV